MIRILGKSNSYLMQIIYNDVFDLIAGDRFPVTIDGSLGNDDDVQPLAGLACAPQLFAQLLGPVDDGRELRNEHEVGLCGHGGHEGQVSAVPTHDLHDEGPLMGGGRWYDAIHGLDDSM